MTNAVAAYAARENDRRPTPLRFPDPGKPVKNDKDQAIIISLGEFALPVPRTGSLEAPSGYGRSTAQGLEIHQRVQKKRAKADSRYQAEVAVTRTLARGGFSFRINGRMDGIFRHDTPLIEEIKSTFGLAELKRRLAGGPLEHPYCLQLLTYGYFYWLEHGIVPALSFHLVSSRTGHSADLPLELDLECYQRWLDARLDELVVEAEKARKQALRRRKLAADFAFPFSAPRPGQIGLMEEIEEGMREGKPMLIQAPTGLGKTVGVLHPVLREALSRGQQVIYLTPKNSQHAVAEDAAERFREGGSPLRSTTLTAKAKICLKEEPLCTPEYCEYARDYYGKLAREGVVDLLAKKRKLKAKTFREIGERFEVCPFELQIDSAKLSDLVICDYNYVFAPRSALGRAPGLAVDQAGKPNLVIDEAHNLPARAMDYYSPQLSSQLLEGFREPLGALPERFAREGEGLLDACLATLSSCRKGGQPSRIDPPLAPFLERDAALRTYLARYLEADHELGGEDPVLRLTGYWGEFTQMLELAVRSERQEFFTTFHPHVSGGSLRITCCDASAMLSECYGNYQQVVGFSATLKPFSYYATLSGLDPAKVRTAEFASPFSREKRKLLVIPQVSTRYSRREQNYGKVAEVLERVAALRPGNYLAFFPSFEFLERVAALFRPPEGFALLKQERSMRQARVDEILDHLREASSPTVLLAVQGGSFAEGIDYPGEMVIGVFVVGPPLPTFDLEREEMRNYYQRHYGAGFDYAYAIPAMAKAVQAAGRVIRSEHDRGIVVLMDDRFLEAEYRCSMPSDWFDSHPSELVSTAILGDLAAFWSEE